MADWIDGTERHRRWALFLRTQSPVTATVVLLLLLIPFFGLPVERPAWLLAGVALITLATVLAVTVRWYRLPPNSHAVLPVLDLVGILLLSIALIGTVNHVGVLTVFPAMWLGAAFAVRGAIVGVAGAYVAALLPLISTTGPYSREEWASAFVIPVVVAVLAAVSVLIARAVRSSLTARDAAVTESERIEAVMRSFFDEVDLGLVFLDERGHSVLFNQAILDFGSLAGHGTDGGLGSRVYAADQVTRLALEDQPLARVRRGESFEDLLYWVGPRGGQRALLASGRPVLRSDGRPAGAILVVQDFTERLRSNRAREDALATLAHELRTPLTSIVGYTDLVLSEDLGHEASARLEVVARNAEHLLKLTTRFLDDLDREVDLQRERVPVTELVDDALEVLTGTPGFADRDVHTDIHGALSVVADAQAIAAVLNNLIGNAVKFSNPGDRISVAAGEDESWVSIVVHNSGSGIDTEDLERIFDRFYRGRNAQRGAVAGTGIGLWVSRQIATAHGGTLTAEDVEEGASFKLCLPRD